MIPVPSTTEAPVVETVSEAETEESTPPADTSEETMESQPEMEDTAETGLVVYFSWSGNTEPDAEVLDGLSLGSSQAAEPASAVTDWLNGLAE